MSSSRVWEKYHICGKIVEKREKLKEKIPTSQIEENLNIGGPDICILRYMVVHYIRLH